MKIVSRFFMLFLCLVLASACAQDEPLAPENGGNTSTPELSTRTIHMTAGTASAGDVTRTTLEGVNVLWDEGDQFRVMDTNGLDWVMKADEDAKAHTSGGFTGSTTSDVKPTSTAMAVFPSNGLTSYTDGNLTITIPQTQTYVAGSFDHKANVMVGPVTPVTGVTDTYSAEFYNMMGVLKLQLMGNETVSSIALMDNDPQSNLWGTATLSAANFSNGISNTNISNGGHIIVLNCHNGVQLSQEESTPFYFVVPAGAFANGFTATVYTTDNKYQDISTTKSQTISKNSIKAMNAVGVKATEILEEVDIENVAVKAYMGQNITSKPRFGSSTWINSTSTKNEYKDQDTPLGKEITWNANYNETIKVTLIDLVPDSKSKNFETSVTANNYTFYNLVPGHSYKYIISDSQNHIKVGYFKVKPNQVRMVKITDSWNWRDLGGWPSTLGGHVKYEWLYRGGSLNGKWLKKLTFGFLNLGSDADKSSSTDIANPENYEFSQISRDEIIAMGIQGELDFRNTKEEKSDKDYSHALALQNTAGQAIPNTGIDGWTYERIKTSDALSSPLGNDAVVRDVEYLIDQVLSGHPTAFHCKSGADRTGAVAFIILALLGVEEGYIAQDYELTNYSSELGRIQTKTSEFRDRKANDKKKEINTFLTDGIKKSSFPGNTLQEKAYYYLNQTFKNQGITIKADDLDDFIKFMLDIDTYNHPSWAE